MLKVAILPWPGIPWGGGLASPGSPRSKGGVLEGGVGHFQKSKVHWGGYQVRGGGCYKVTVVLEFLSIEYLRKGLSRAHPAAGTHLASYLAEPAAEV